MGNTRWQIRLIIGVVFALFVIGYTLVESARHYDFVHNCHCGSQAVYYADRFGYILQQVALPALLGVLIIAVTINHPLFGVLVLVAVFAITGWAQIRAGQISDSNSELYYGYLQTLGTVRLIVGGVWGIVVILAGIGIFITGNGQQGTTDK